VWAEEATTNGQERHRFIVRFANVRKLGFSGCITHVVCANQHNVQAWTGLEGVLTIILAQDEEVGTCVLSYRCCDCHIGSQLSRRALLGNPVEIDILSFRFDFLGKWDVFNKFLAYAMEEIDRCDVQDFRFAHEDDSGFDGTAGIGEIEGHFVGRCDEKRKDRVGDVFDETKLMDLMALSGRQMVVLYTFCQMVSKHCCLQIYGLELSCRPYPPRESRLCPIVVWDCVFRMVFTR
jgi:hypothetical protein